MLDSKKVNWEIPVQQKFGSIIAEFHLNTEGQPSTHQESKSICIFGV